MNRVEIKSKYFHVNVVEEESCSIYNKYGETFRTIATLHVTQTDITIMVIKLKLWSIHQTSALIFHLIVVLHPLTVIMLIYFTTNLQNDT